MNHFKYTLILAYTCLAFVASGQNYTTPFNHSLLDETYYDLLIGESSGDRAYHYVMDIAPYERDRKHTDYQGLFMESRYVVDKLKEFGIQNAKTERVGKTKTWDGISASLWEVYPKQVKIADYQDLAATLGQGSKNADVTAQLAWIGRGEAHEIKAVDLKGKIAVTEAAASRIHDKAVEAGAVGIISYYSPRPLIDPLQIPNSGIRSQKPTFCFNLTPRDGHALRDRLLRGEKITVHAKVETTEEETDIEVPTCLIPGTAPNVEEVIFSAHLFEGYVKLGANDNISGSAALLEVARTLNNLFDSGKLPRPKRSIRFIWVPEFQGTMPWAKQNKEILSRTLCNINLDMVGLWLSKSGSYYCLHRTTMGNPHYLNDVSESFFHYMGATNKSFVATGMGRPDALKPVYSLTGSQDPFYSSINAHSGYSDHEVFSDWGVQVPGVIMITWPDNYYHTSGDRPSICDPTQLHRAIVLAAATAYTIAAADENQALAIANQVASNAARRMSIKASDDLTQLYQTAGEQFAASYKKAKFNQDALLINEKATLESIMELAPSSTLLKNHIASLQNTLQEKSASNHKEIYAAMKARAAMLKIAPIKRIELTEEEKSASKIFPHSTAKVKETGYGVLQSIPKELTEKYKPSQETGSTYTRMALAHGDDIAKLTVSGKNSILDIKKMQDAQFPDADKLEDIIRFLDMLKEAGLVTF